MATIVRAMVTFLLLHSLFVGEGREQLMDPLSCGSSDPILLLPLLVCVLGSRELPKNTDACLCHLVHQNLTSQTLPRGHELTEDRCVKKDKGCASSVVVSMREILMSIEIDELL